MSYCKNRIMNSFDFENFIIISLFKFTKDLESKTVKSNNMIICAEFNENKGEETYHFIEISSENLFKLKIFYPVEAIFHLLVR